MISPFLCVFTYIHAENINRFHGFNEKLLGKPLFTCDAQGIACPEILSLWWEL